MSELHRLLTFPSRPITDAAYATELHRFLVSGIPATYTLEQVAAFEQGRGAEQDDIDGSNTTPLHILARSLPLSLTEEETDVVLKMMDILFEYGAGWNFIDYENKTIGDLLLEKGQDRNGKLYKRVVAAGVSAELLLRKINGGEIEFLEVDRDDQAQEETVSTTAAVVQPDTDRTADDSKTYLATPLEYTDDSLITKDNKDGVMMDWETEIMAVAAKTICSTGSAKEKIILNVGFGMGIIDTFIQKEKPTQHYICEAHPDVLARMKTDGWYDRPNVIILEGKWQDSLNKLLDEGDTFFDGIYYDTFSEHYQDMLDLYDVVVGLLKPEGVFSFFNGLGADRPLCYDVYREIVTIDVNNYGMNCQYANVSVNLNQDWQNVKRSYFNCNYYYHPRITFT